jgi:Domain of unknown function (DUF4281)
MASILRFQKRFLLWAIFFHTLSMSRAFVAPVGRPTHGVLIQHRQQQDAGRTTSTSSTTSLSMDIVGVSPEPIHTAFALATFGPQPFWLLMILLPKNDITKKVMGSMGAFCSCE